METQLQRKITLGFIANLLVLASVAAIYMIRFFSIETFISIKQQDTISFGLTLLSIVLVFIVYLILNKQMKQRMEAQLSLIDNKKLLQSVIDSTTNPISIKKINGEYLFVNKPFELLFKISPDNVIGKTDHDILEKEVADEYRASDLEVIKANKEIKLEEVINVENVPHTYIASKFPLFDSSGRIYAIGSIATDINERKKMEESLVEGEKFFQISLEIMVIASGEKFIRINPALSQILGYSDEELLSRPFNSFILQDDIEITNKVIQQLQMGIKTINFENRWVCKNGKIKWLSWTAQSDAKNNKLYATAHDITERINYQESLKAGNTFFNMSFDGMVIANNEYFIKVNPSFTKILGITQKDLDKEPFLSFTHPDDIERSKIEVGKLARGEAMVNFRVRARCKDGTYKWVEWNATMDPKTGLMYGIVRDISDRIKMEEEQKKIMKQLFENEQRLKLVLENISDGVIVTDQNHEIIMANYSANEIFGVDEDGIVSKEELDHYELYFPDGKTIFPSQNLPLSRALNGEVIDDVDLILRDPDTKTSKRVLISGRPLVDEEKNVMAAVVTIKDISRYKQMERELKESEQKLRQAIGFHS